MAILIEPKESLAINYRKKAVEKEILFKFNQALVTLFDELDVAKGEPFCEHKIQEFLSSVFYEETNAISHAESVDLVIYSGLKTKTSHPIVLFEIKTPNNKADMPKNGNINCKGMCELVLYYVRQEFEDRNNDIRHLVLTNGIDWYVFKKSEFFKYFGKKTVYEEILRQDRTQTTEYVYQRVITPLLEKCHSNIKCCYFSLADYRMKLHKNPGLTSITLTYIYKVLSPTHLLEEAVMIDHTQLNRDFYTELLYIMGLHEITDKAVGLKIVRFDEEDRQPHSLIEETITTLKEVHPSLNDDETEDVALGLVLTWTNRILFVKLLEGLLGSFEEENTFRKYLTPERIDTFQKLEDLFIKVLAKAYDERTNEILSIFSDIPYLNSSLFEYSQLEVSTIRMRELHQGGTLKPYKQTRVRNNNGTRQTGDIDVLKYLLLFLDAYDFSGSEEGDESSIINASVLGKIFEKINGYKDGAFYTPSQVSEYMCRVVIRQAILDKYNQESGTDYTTFEELKDSIDFVDRSVRCFVNDLINGLHICDPSVGSGHFLVSALNELLVVKSELNVLMRYDTTERIRDYKLSIQNGELQVQDLESGRPFTYKHNHGLIMQRTLFMEKRTIIENCLFGSDINPKSVDICRLRLWIELLKSAYYDENDVLQTLPNIDINIQCGDSLLSMYDVECGKRCLDESHKEYIEDYITAVREYKNCDNKHIKQKLTQRFNKWLAKWTYKPKTQLFFDDNDNLVKEQIKVEWMLAFPDLMKEDGTFIGFDVVIGNPPYISISALDKETINNYFEHSDANKKQKTPRKDSYLTFSKNADIYSLFFERGIQLLKSGGHLCFITSRKWMRNDSGAKTREFITSKTNPILLIDMPGVQLFEKATVETDILWVKKDKFENKLLGTIISKKSKKMFSNLQNTLLPLAFSGSETWVIKKKEDVLIEMFVKDKCKKLIDFGTSINRGITTGNNDAFVIDSEQRKRILQNCSDDEERQLTDSLIKPVLKGDALKAYSVQWKDKWVLTLFPVRELNIDDYPAVKKWLLEFELDKLIAKGQTKIAENHLHEYCQQKLEQKGMKVLIEGEPVILVGNQPIKSRKKTAFKWFETQDSIAFYKDFEKPKIIWGEISDTPKFYFDEVGTYFCEATTFFMTGQHLIYLMCYLNSPLSKFLFDKLGTTTGQGTVRWKKYKIEQQLVPDVDAGTEKRIEELYHKYMQTKEESLLEDINKEIYDFLQLTPDQIDIINKK